MDTAEKEKILVVDDEESILDIVREYFQHKEYRVVTAKNGIEALKILHKEKIDCCFTDINMPEMDGLELAEHIRATDNTIPVIVMTAYPSFDNTIRTLKNGVVDFLIKPVNLNQMEICVKRVLRERQLFIENILLKKEVESKSRLEKLNKELLSKVGELHLLNKIMSDFTTITTSSDVFKWVVDMTIEVTHSDESRFYIINEAMERPFEVSASYADPKDETVDSEGISKTAQLPLSDSQKRISESHSMDRMIMEIVADEIPLLVPENRGVNGIPPGISSFIIVPLKIREKVFGVLTASIKKADKRFTEKDLFYLTFMTQKAAYAIENLALYENIYENLFSTLYAFVKTIEAKDPYTHQHSNRVTGIAIVIGSEMGCTTEELDILNFAGPLHDIGKIGIRDGILQKPDRLTSEEFEKIKEHPVIGASIVGQLGLWDREQEIIRHHHERFDGMGYPDGLKEEEIPFLARVLSVADAYDAMASDRAYRKRMEESKILEIIQEQRGRQFDPDVVEAFRKTYDDGKIHQARTERIAGLEG
jgi:putative nucleotidyltransferase with HDIG domain